jgi:hypothetical protein
VSDVQDVAEVLRDPSARKRVSKVSSVNVGTAERWLSALAGAGLTMAGLARRSPGGIVLAAAGGALVWRGLGGTCLAYRALGWSTAAAVPRMNERGADRWAVRPTVPFGEAASRLGQTREERLESDLEQSFPASDVPGHMGRTTTAGSAPGRSDNG